MKILLSGGHLTPALAMIDYLQENHPEDELVFVGRIYSQNKLKQKAREKAEITKRGIKFIAFDAPKKPTPINFFHLFISKLLLPGKFFVAFLKAWKIFKTHRPDVYLSFGGYLALPLSLAAKITKTRIITHEQTHAAGFANQFIAKFADKVAISDSASLHYFPQEKTVLTGNPIRPQLLEKKPTPPKWIKNTINTKESLPLLLIMGGSQGALIINHTVEKALKELTKKWQIVHLCGRANQAHNYYEELTRAKSQLPVAQKKNYLVREWASAADLAWLYKNATLGLSRAGANSVMEITALNLPTLFIPLENTHHQEQRKNAQQLVDKKAALILPQSKLTPESLVTCLEELQKSASPFKKNLQKYTLSPSATKKIYQLIQSDPHAQKKKTI